MRSEPVNMTIARPQDVAAVVAHCRCTLALTPSTRLGPECFYASLPLCVIDAVFSMNTRYAAVENVIERVCARLQIPRFAREPGVVPPQSEQPSVSEFLARIGNGAAEHLAANLFENRQRT